MNFFAHAIVASWHSREPRFVFGAMLPDLIGMTGVRLAGTSDEVLRRGIDLHHATDAAFHAAPIFTGMCAEAIARLALHLYAFLLLLFSVGMLVAKLASLSGFGGLETPVVDKVLSIANLAACNWYLYRAIGPVYAAAGKVRVLQAMALSLAVAAIVLGYRFGLFIVTLYST